MWPLQAALAQVLEEELEGVRAVAASQDPTSPFGPSTSPRINHTLIRTLPFTCEGKGECQYPYREHTFMK